MGGSKLVRLSFSIEEDLNGKFRGTVHVVAGLDNDSLSEAALADEKIAKAIEKTGKSVFKTIVVPNKLVNFIVK